MHVIGLILFAMALGLGALFLLAKAQKENLGKLYTVSGYVVLTVSMLTIVFAITAGILHHCHKKGCGGGSCGKQKSEMGCSSKGHGDCKMNAKHGKTDGMCGASMSESCPMGMGKGSKNGSCCEEGMGGKGGDCMMMNHHGGKMFEKKIIRKIDGDSVDVQVEVKTK